MNIFTLFLYFINWVVLIAFYLKKYKDRKYIFSPFNLSVFIGLFSLLIAPWFFFNDEAWIALGNIKAVELKEQLNICLQINLFGQIIYFLTAYFVEFKNVKNISNELFKELNRFKFAISRNLFIGCIAFWYLIVFIFNKGIPLFNGGRTFYLNTPISPIYLFLNSIILIYSIIYGFQFATKRKDILFFMISVVTLLFTGNRGDVLTSVLFPVFVYMLYRTNYSSKQITKNIIILCLMLFVIGCSLSLVRNSNGINIQNILTELFYGNTFSDIRDGAYILKGWTDKKIGFLYGKTYLAGALSFIPSRFFSFRKTWAWGRFSTEMLFGWIGHTGLRGGNYMEAYLNFGLIGIILVSIIQGLITGGIENIFYEKCIKTRKGLNVMDILFILIISKISGFFICSAGTFNFYVLIFFIIINLLITSGKINELINRFRK